MAALELKWHLGVSYRTAWRLKHKVMEAMMQREELHQYSGFVQIDDACLGGELDGGKSGRDSENKQAFVIAVETDANLEHPRFAVIEPVRHRDAGSMCLDRALPQRCQHRDYWFGMRIVEPFRNAGLYSSQRGLPDDTKYSVPVDIPVRRERNPTWAISHVCNARSCCYGMHAYLIREGCGLLSTPL
jgi:hypothetical protein